MQKLVFLINSDRTEASGTTEMRGRQLIEIINARSDKIFAEGVERSEGLNNEVIWVTKGAAKSLTMNEKKHLRARGNILLVDYVDRRMRPSRARGYHGMIAASRYAMRLYTLLYPFKKRFYVAHHVDQNLPIGNHCREFRAAYFGDLQNVYSSPEIESALDVLSITDPDWREKTENYSFHYALRPNGLWNRAKPLTKALVAARLRANILIPRAEPEARLLLPKDYPYFYDGPLETAPVLEALEAAKQSYGSEKWQKGLDQLEALNQAHSPEIIVKQIEDMVEQAKKIWWA